MKPRVRLEMFVVFIGASLLLFLSSSPRAQQPTTVFVYNDEAGDNFNTNAKRYIFQELGLVDANGRPGVVDGNNVVDHADPPNVLGHVIRDPNTQAIIGYRSADGTREAYDVNSTATTSQAWQRVANNGELHIYKHGTAWEDDDGNEHEGGGIILDGGRPYDGFGGAPGTGAGFGNGAYPLPARPGANITLNLNSCWSSKDPEGDVGSVTASADDEPGVGSTEGHEGEVYPVTNWDPQGGTAAQREAVEAALRTAARQAGFPPVPDDGSPRAATTNSHVGSWLSSLPFGRAQTTAQTIADKVAPPPGTVTVGLTYAKAEQQPAPGENSGGVHVCPTLLTDQTCTEKRFTFSETLFPAILEACPGALSAPTMFEIDLHGLLPASPPPGYSQASGCFSFQNVFGGTILEPLSIRMTFWGDPGTAEVFWYDPALPGWTPPSGVVSIDQGLNTAIISTMEMGIYTVFQPGAGGDIPTLTEWGLIILGMVLLGFITWVFLKRRKVIGLGL